MKRKIKISINRILILYISMIIIVPLFLIGAGSYAIFNFYTYDQIISKNKFIVTDVTDRIDQVVAIITDEIASIATVIAKAENEDITQYTFYQLFNRYKFFDSILYYNADNKLTYSYPERKYFYNFDFSYKDTLIKTRRTGEPVWSNVQLSEFSNKPSISYTVPAISNGELKGIITGTINIEKLLEESSTINTTNKTLMMIITDAKNTILVHPDKNKISKMQKLQINIVKNKNTAYVDGEKFILCSDVIKTTGWNIYLLQSFNNAFAPMIFLRSLLLLVLFSSFIITAVSVYMSYTKMFTPLKLITSYTTKMARGTYDAFPNIDFNIKEIQVLADNFKRMIKKITLREKSLKESEEKYRNLVEENIDSIFRISSNLTITYVSSSIEKLIGYTPEEISGMIKKIQGQTTLLPDKKHNIRALKAIKECFLKNTIPEPFIVKILHKDNFFIYLEIQTKPLKNQYGVVTELQATARDVTRRYIAEQKAEFFRNYFFSIIDSMPSSLITFSGTGEIDQYNTASLIFLNKNGPDIKGKKLWDISPHYDEYRKYFEVVKNTGMPLDFNDKIETENGSIYCKITLFPLKTYQDTLVLRIDDITKLVTTERQLRQAQKLKSIGNMAGGLAHDFNNVLGALTGAINLIEYKLQNNLEVIFEEDIEIIKEATDRGKNIIKQLSVISKPVNSKFTVCDLNFLLDKIVAEQQQLLSNKIKFNYMTHKSSALTTGNPDHLEEMLRNIINNSIESIEKEGNITITLHQVKDDETKDYAQARENFWQIAITDTGYGIPEEDIENIFDPFYKNKITGKRHGIGLTLAYNTARNHNGFIDCYSDKEKGATFTVYLPSISEITDVAAYYDPVKKEKKLIRGTGNILVVDDENVIRYTSAKMLELCGYTVIEAKNGTEALALFKEKHNEISCVLLDFFMPDINGLEVYQKLIKIDKNVKTVLSSGINNHPKIEEALQTGIKYFLQKPYSIEDLSETIDAAIHS